MDVLMQEGTAWATVVILDVYLYTQVSGLYHDMMAKWDHPSCGFIISLLDLQHFISQPTTLNLSTYTLDLLPPHPLLSHPLALHALLSHPASHVLSYRCTILNPHPLSYVLYFILLENIVRG